MNTKEMLLKALKDGRVPDHATCCFIEECPKKNECLHYLCWSWLWQNRKSGNSVFPEALRNGECKLFAPLRVVRTAWGFDALFKDVKLRDAKTLRQQMREILGSKGQYYRYKLGQRKLLPEQQDEIKRLFSEFGYADADFDNFSTELDLTKLRV